MKSRSKIVTHRHPVTRFGFLLLARNADAVHILDHCYTRTRKYDATVNSEERKHGPIGCGIFALEPIGNEFPQFFRLFRRLSTYLSDTARYTIARNRFRSRSTAHFSPTYSGPPLRGPRPGPGPGPGPGRYVPIVPALVASASHRVRSGEKTNGGPTREASLRTRPFRQYTLHTCVKTGTRRDVAIRSRSIRFRRKRKRPSTPH